jgi:hypothetical protein
LTKGTVAERHRAVRKRHCRHHWVIESPHGATSLGHCRSCGKTKRFPNAAEDALLDPEKARLGRWSRPKDATQVNPGSRN